MNDGYDLVVDSVGGAQWPRWLIRDSEQRFFTGATWSENRVKALLFADRAAAEAECEKLQRDSAPRVFQVSVLVEVDAIERLSIEEIRDYLSRNLHAVLDEGDRCHPCYRAEYDFLFIWPKLDEASQ